MQVKDIMTTDVACCTPDTSIQEAARIMVNNDCGCLPVAQDQSSMRVQGVITDRDITCRAVANGMDPNTTAVAHCMTSAPMSVGPNASLEECERLMEHFQVRRIPVVTETGSCCGMVSQADIALAAPGHIVHIVKEISKPTQMAA